MERFFELRTHKLAYRLQETPGKDRVLFLHGLGANLSQFDREFTRLAKDYSVAALSLRGQGNSTRPPGDNPDDMKISALAFDVIQWMHAHKWEQPHVIACSMGGVVALEILQQQSQLFKSLITFGTTPKLKLPKMAIKAGAWLSDIFLPGLFPNWMAKTLPKTTTDKPEAQQRFAADLKVAYGQRKTIYQLRCELANYDYTQVLYESIIPVLLLQGEKDTAINKEIEKLWPKLKENPFVKREFIKDAGHIANYDQPQAFYNSVIHFFEELES
ncbi:alpha/beta fold hydrolase [Dethiobacter alkaliphilus]|uniref:Alpha/beta hydrolase fold protein n=1 Tax=Dethiobacter alkaliphilus AHT 1 TaxID=555088 RepID=C0GFF4_DETAL|nr:alpha/beta hydrolase [Dethiobacter alkaliphilus]EEG77914.1 alpha/beta hydrolase fold protein [Dethiobacter alkaliphilus AHT 1]